MQPLQVRPYAMGVLVRLRMAMKCLAAVEPKTDQALSTDCYRCPFRNDGALGVRQQQRNTLVEAVAAAFLSFSHLNPRGGITIRVSRGTNS